MLRLTILVTSAGRRVELLNCFRAGAAAVGIDLTLLACDLQPRLSSACCSADAAFAVPRADDAGYADALLCICAAHGVGLVVPTIDPELMPLSLNRERFAALGCTVAVSDPDLVATARDKLHTARFLAAHGVASPQTRSLDAVLADPADWIWPTFVKPRHGSAGRGVRVVLSPADVPPVTEPMIAQDVLRGPEFTVNMFFDAAGRLRSTVPHQRLQVRAGEVEKGLTIDIAELTAAAHRLAAALPGPRGALCFQAMLDADGGAQVFEINARFGGGYPLADRAGATFARWLIEEALGLDSSITDRWLPGVTMLRYDAAIFVAP